MKIKRRRNKTKERKIQKKMQKKEMKWNFIEISRIWEQE